MELCLTCTNPTISKRSGNYINKTNVNSVEKELLLHYDGLVQEWYNSSELFSNGVMSFLH